MRNPEVCAASMQEWRGIAPRRELPPFHFARCFRATVGLAPHHYLVRSRLTKARELLEKTSLPVAEVAARVGYEDASYFARLFRREIGVTPLKYRKERRL